MEEFLCRKKFCEYYGPEGVYSWWIDTLLSINTFLGTNCHLYSADFVAACIFLSILNIFKFLYSVYTLQLLMLLSVSSIFSMSFERQSGHEP